MDVKQDQLLQK